MRSKYILLLFLSQIIILANCAKREQTSDKINIVVSISPLAEFTEKVGGDKVNVAVMIPEGASPHSYEPKPSQLVKVSKADAYIKVGTPIEFELMWIDKLISMNKKMSIIDASENIKSIFSEHEHEHDVNDHEHEHKSDRMEKTDPHIWLSPENARIMVQTIYEALKKIDPKNLDYFKSNTDAYLHELHTLDNEIASKLADKKNRKFMIYHPAWGYFADHYNLQQIAIEKEGKEPTAKGVQNVIRQAKNNNIKIIFVSPQFQISSAELIAKEIGGRVELISPMAKDYIKNINTFVQLLFDSME
jgi:zinc transport system substrate-binding protein